MRRQWLRRWFMLGAIICGPGSSYASADATPSSQVIDLECHRAFAIVLTAYSSGHAALTDAATLRCRKRKRDVVVTILPDSKINDDETSYLVERGSLRILEEHESGYRFQKKR